MTEQRRSNQDKIALFRSRLVDGSLTHLHGSYDPRTGKAFQVKNQITDDTIYRHLKGTAPLGSYLLVGNKTCRMVVDFDQEDANPPLEFMAHARHYSVPAYLEKSKSKGWHIWVFFDQPVLAAKTRLVVRHILAEIGQDCVEVFPKQDALDPRVPCGNFINLPLFGLLIPHRRTVFVDENLVPYPNQWDFLAGIERIHEGRLDWVMDMNGLALPQVPLANSGAAAHRQAEGSGIMRMGYGLPPCAQRMLNEGVNFNQRVAAFRLAVQLRKAGLGEDLVLAALQTWAPKNRPADGRTIITAKEIAEQVHSAFLHQAYRGIGCHDETVNTFCEKSCPLYLKFHGETAA